MEVTTKLSDYKGDKSKLGHCAVELQLKPQSFGERTFQGINLSDEW
jgi:hypothetical protein